MNLRLRWYRIGAWWAPGPLRPQGNPLQRWARLHCIGRRRQARAAWRRGELMQSMLSDVLGMAMLTTLVLPGRRTADVIEAARRSLPLPPPPPPPPPPPGGRWSIGGVRVHDSGQWEYGPVRRSPPPPGGH